MFRFVRHLEHAHRHPRLEAVERVGRVRRQLRLQLRECPGTQQRAQALPLPQASVGLVFGPPLLGAAERSEEHTSELQSLMRISYAVFCLKKKNNTITTQHNDNRIDLQT